MKNFIFKMTTGTNLKELVCWPIFALCCAILFNTGFIEEAEASLNTATKILLGIVLGVLFAVASYVLSMVILKTFNLYHRTFVRTLGCGTSYLIRKRKIFCYRLKTESDGTPVTMVGWLSLSDAFYSKEWHMYRNDKENIVKAAKIAYNDTDYNITTVNGVDVEAFRCYGPSASGDFELLTDKINVGDNSDAHWKTWGF